MTVTVALLQEFVMKEHEKSNNDTTIILSGGKRERATRLGGRAADPGFSTNQIAQARFYVWSTYFFANLHKPISSSCWDNSLRVILQRCCHC